jgi:hypothetical protein
MNTLRLAVALFTMTLLTNHSRAGFHVMQIEQIIGGINGDTSAQAIQLRMKSSGQTVLGNSKLWAADATGGNRVLLLDLTASVTNGAQGARVLLTSSSFNNLMLAGGATGFSPDFTLANTMPSGFLTAGRITFEDNNGSTANAGTIYWSVSWGGASYTGSNTGATTNDTDGNFGPAFGSALPSSSRQGIIFTGASTANSVSNSTDYALTANPATVTRNNGTAFTVVPEPGTCALLGALGFGIFAIARRRTA